MAENRSPVDAQLQQLGEARTLVLKDPGYWPQVLQGTLPIITGPIVEVRRWGADFLAETFSTPLVDARAKQELALACLDTLLRLANETETGILKSVAQCSASVYPIIFRHICSDRADSDTWNKIVAIKSKILSLWDSASIGVRISCVKFAQRVILVQSRGVTDPRLVDRSEVNLSAVPANHPILSLPSLDAEAQGLLDRLLSILHEENREPQLVTATVNNLAVVVKTRPPLAAKVIGAVIGFNPFARASPPVTVQDRLVMISIEKTVRIMLLNVMRSNPQGPFTGRISQHIARLSQAKAELNDTFSRKRAAGTQDTDAFKRQKMDRIAAMQEAIAPVATLPLPQAQLPASPMEKMLPGPVTYAKLFTLATDPALTSFDGQQLPLDLVLQIVVGSLYRLDQNKLDAAIAAVNARYEVVMANPQALPLVPTAPQALDDAVASIASGMPDNAISAKHEGERIAEQDLDTRLQLSEFKFPPPPRASPDQMQAASVDAVDRMFEIIDDFEKTSLIARKNQLGVNRLAASSWDREGWTSFIIRIATRGSTDDFVKSEEHGSTGVADYIRERLYQYISQDFRRRLDVAIAWLNEEWYNDKIMAGLEEGAHREPQYQKWMMRLMDGIIPFLEGKDRIFMRMLSEIPEVPRELLEKIKIICLDPDRVTLGIQMLHFLVMLRPPVREMCVDVLEDLYLNHLEVQPQTQKLLQKYRPATLIKNEAEIKTNGNGNGAPTPNTYDGGATA